MKILVINGTPHKGNTWILVKQVMSKISSLSKDVLFDEVHLLKINIPICVGCSKCLIKGHQYCPHILLTQNILNKIESSDAIIIACSCYANHATALSKNLIDHLSFVTHRPRFFTKKALMISTSGGKGSKTVTKYLADTFSSWGFNKTHELSVDTRFSYGNYIPSEKIVNKCDKVAKSFYIDVLNKKLKQPSFTQIFVYNIFRGMSRAGQGEEFYDNVYWNETGLINDPYSLKIKLSMLKKISGNLIYLVVSKIAKRVQITYKK